MMVVSGNELIKMIDRKEHINKRFYIRLIYDETVPGGLDDVYRNREFVIDKFGNIFTDDDIAKIKDINIFRKSFFAIKGYEEIEIDINSIEEIDLFNNGIGFKDVYLVMRSYDNNFKKITDKYNEVIRAIKQINKQMKEK